MLNGLLNKTKLVMKHFENRVSPGRKGAIYRAISYVGMKKNKNVIHCKRKQLVSFEDETGQKKSKLKIDYWIIQYRMFNKPACHHETRYYISEVKPIFLQAKTTITTGSPHVMFPETYADLTYYHLDEKSISLKNISQDEVKTLIIHKDNDTYVVAVNPLAPLPDVRQDLSTVWQLENDRRKQKNGRRKKDLQSMQKVEEKLFRIFDLEKHRRKQEKERIIWQPEEVPSKIEAAKAVN